MRHDPICFGTPLAAFVIVLAALAAGDAQAAEQSTQPTLSHDKPVFNRAPLLSNRFAKLPLGSIQAKGYLRH